MSDARERTARLLGVGTAIAAMLLAWRALGWPAPGLSAVLGLLVYRLARTGT